MSPPSESTLYNPTPQNPDASNLSRRDYKFWLVFLAIGISQVISVLELSAVSTALPTIVSDLHGTDSFVWISSAYALAATAFVPMAGGFAQVFGRRVIILGALIIMSVGSVLSGVAKNMNFLIVGRTIQGVGGGAIASTNAIIISDLVPLRERGVFNGLVGIVWGVASGIGPIVGGALAENGQWRWLFYLNVPIAAVAFILFAAFLRVRTPPGTVREKLQRVDWIGNAMVIGATAACVIALTWGGTQYAWGSAQVLAPLIIGILGLVGFLVYEAFVPKYPLVPRVLMSTITGISGYIQTFLMPITMIALIYYVPVYFQACHAETPVEAGEAQLAGTIVLAPTGIIAGMTVNKLRRYRPQLWASWAILLVGISLFITLDADTPRGHGIGFLIICGVGIGCLTTTTYFPVLAPLSVAQNAPALAFFMFLRNFAQVWGVTIGGAVLQNELQKSLPHDLVAALPGGTAISYAAIPLISTLQEPLKTQTRVAFAEGLKVVWEVMAAIAGLGLLSSLLMRALPLHNAVDEEWGLQEQDTQTQGTKDPERLNISSHGITIPYDIELLPALVKKHSQIANVE